MIKNKDRDRFTMETWCETKAAAGKGLILAT